VALLDAATGQMVVVDALSERFTRVPSGGWNEPANAAVLLALMHQAEGRPYGILMAGSQPLPSFQPGVRGVPQAHRQRDRGEHRQRPGLRIGTSPR
jgi:hypothetical protein